MFLLLNFISSFYSKIEARFSDKQITFLSALQIVATAFWLIMNLMPISNYGETAFELILKWGTFQISTNQIFPVTYASAWGSFVVSICIFVLRQKVEIFKAVFLSASVPFAGAGLFEFIYQNLAIVLRPQIVHTKLVGELLMVIWIFFAFVCMKYWKLSKPFVLITAIYIADWIGWAVIGYPQFYENSEAGLFLNVSLKVLSFVLFMTLIQTKFSNVERM
jgi:hypothetical protein